MFTPPPSPDPRAALTASTSSSSPTTPSDTSLKLDVRDDPFLSPSSASSSRSSTPTPPPRPHGETPLSPKEDPWAYAQQRHAEKKRIGRRIRWAVLLAPLVFVLVGLSTRYLTHPAALDLLSSHETNSGWAAISDWSPHKRHAAPEPAATTIDESTPSGTSLSIAATASSSASATSAAAGSGSTTVPTSKPVLPTPFPQPFDSTLSSNYSTVGCQDFMTNMTQTPAFRQCRPFSLLVQDSNAFITNQKNISEMNVIIWGTCNTDVAEDQCGANMAWFAENIQTSCAKDLANKNSIVTDALAGLQAYSTMRTAACLIDNSTDTYCYVSAAGASGHPSDLYLYQLPLGLSLPSSALPSCTSCVQQVMDVFAAQDATAIPGLAETYASAAAVVNGACGATFVADVEVGTSGAAASTRMRAAVAAGALGVIFAALMVL